MRAVALLGLYAGERDVRRFQMPGVNLVSGNELDPTDQPDAALIFGGDGTIHRYLSGLVLKQIPTLIVPLGSANDFAQSIGVPTLAKSLAAWQRFCTVGDNVKAIDLGTIQPLTGAPSSEGSTGVGPASQGESPETLHFIPQGPRRDLPQMRARIMQSQLRHRTEAGSELAGTAFFCCIAGTGLDAAVNRRALRQSRWVRGHGGYILALLQTLGGFHPPHIAVSVESAGVWQTRIDEPGFLIAAGNGPQYGNGMRLTHQACMDDGLLDLCFVRLLGKARLLRLFRVVYKGRHLGMKEVEYFPAQRLRIVTEPVMEVFADGEYICRTPVEIGIRRDALRIIVAR
ncbi:MAG TPA: diacylglycerol kinase family protein [Candidatus Binatia bacterium]|nr:diacylglycerol kinase family protein [Candidatus Binatia bacterium]